MFWVIIWASLLDKKSAMKGRGVNIKKTGFLQFPTGSFIYAYTHSQHNISNAA